MVNPQLIQVLLVVIPALSALAVAVLKILQK